MPTLSQVSRDLLRRFSRQRPLRAGSLIVTVFGDSLAPRRSEIGLSGLIDSLAPFGITERLARTSIGRLVEQDWLQSRRVGRASFYRLTCAGEERFAEATERIYGPPRRDWNGDWTLVVLPNSLRAAQREAIRKELAWLGFGQWSQSTLAHPESATLDLEGHLGRLGIKSSAVVLRSRSTDVDADRRLAELGWDLTELERRYRRFNAMFEPARRAARDGAALDAPCCFRLRTLLIHEYRRVHLRDPLLPALLLPNAWAGTEAYELCRNLYLRIAEASDEYVTRNLATLHGPLPAPAHTHTQRFRTAG